MVPVVNDLVVGMNKVKKILIKLKRITNEGAILTKSANGNLNPQQKETLKDLAVTVDDMAAAMEAFENELPLMTSLELSICLAW